MHTVEAGQSLYDLIVDGAGCSGSKDTLKCLQGVDAATLKKVTDSTPQLLSSTSLQLNWAPRIDNVTVPNPFKAIRAGAYAKVNHSVLFLKLSCIDVIDELGSYRLWWC